ncbi:hypothetical protein [Endozoicomonas sp. 2B-B]
MTTIIDLGIKIHGLEAGGAWEQKAIFSDMHILFQEGVFIESVFFTITSKIFVQRANHVPFPS